MPSLESRLRAELAAALDRREGPHPVWEDAPVRQRVDRQTAEPRRRQLRLLAIAAVFALGSAAVAGALLLKSKDPEPTHATNGWFASSVINDEIDANFDIRFAKPRSPSTVVIGGRGDALSQTCPSFSPDGTALAYSESATGLDDEAPWTLAIVGLAAGGLPTGATVRWAPADPVPPLGDRPCFRWSPDGTQVSYLAASGLHTLDIESGTDRVVAALDLDRRSEHATFAVGAFAWSPDGTRIAYTRNGGDQQHTSQLWVVDLEGSAFQLSGIVGPDELIAEIAWSPDGTRIAIGGDLMLFDHPRPGETVSSTGPWFIRTADVRVDGGNAVEIESRPELEGHGGGPLWSPDGSRLAYVHASSLWIRDLGEPESREVPIDFSVRSDSVRLTYVGSLHAWSAGADRILLCASSHRFFYQFATSVMAIVDPSGASQPEQVGGCGGDGPGGAGSWQEVHT